MREMRLKKREIKEKKLLLEILEECQVVRIGVTDREGMFLVPMNFGYQWPEGEPLKLYLHSAREGRKAEVFQTSPKAAFELDCGHGLIQGDYTCNYSYSYRSIMGNGRIFPVTKREEKEKALTLLARHLDPLAEIRFSGPMLEAADVYCLEVLELSGKERRQKTEKSREEDV